MKKSFFCHYHNNWFTQVCSGCLKEIFRRSMKETADEHVKFVEPDYSWDETYDFIESFKVQHRKV